MKALMAEKHEAPQYYRFPQQLIILYSNNIEDLIVGKYDSVFRQLILYISPWCFQATHFIYFLGKNVGGMWGGG